MGENSAIEWTDHTFNPWVGCQKVSPGCDHCYAEGWSKRSGMVQWGPHGERKRTSEANWKKPINWAKKVGPGDARPRVFCASLADVFDNKVPTQWRDDLFKLIDETPGLDWLLLTKRPENIERLMPYSSGVRPNVWLGTTCEDQPHYDRRWPILAAVPAAVHFISYEPALGPLEPHGLWVRGRFTWPDWLICGGESGPGRRPFDLAWANAVCDYCASSSIAFFMKQIDKVRPVPDDLMVREFPEVRTPELAPPTVDWPTHKEWVG